MNIVAQISTEKLREDYPRWHWAQVESKDLDPMYPLLRELSDRWRLDEEQRAWLCICHVIWYHPGSTIIAFQLAPSARQLVLDQQLLKLPTTTERRGHRVPSALVKHLEDLQVVFDDGVLPWVYNAIVDLSPKEAWTVLNNELIGIVGNGRWAAYKTAEMLQKVCNVPIQAPDAGHRYSSGPRRGLELLEPDMCPWGNTKGDIAVLDFLTEQWAEELGEQDIAQVETSLCDFNSLVHGRYYLGHDIDAIYDAWMKLSAWIPPEAWDARLAVFDPEYINEGVDKARKRLYLERGIY